MSTNEDEKLARMLHSRHIEPASHDLAARIILQARTLPQLDSISLWRALRQLFVEFHLPKPGYVLASALILGMVLGFGTTPENGPLSDTSSATAHNYISGDEGLL